MNDQQFQEFIGTAMQELQAKQVQLQSEFSIGEWPRWELDQESEQIYFLDESGKIAVQASFIFIGSYAPKSDSWKWGWSNQSITPSLREKALPLKRLKEVTGFDLFGFEGTFDVDEPMAWELAAMSVQLLNAEGCYRAPSDDGGPKSFLALRGVQILNQRQ